MRDRDLGLIKYIYVRFIQNLEKKHILTYIKIPIKMRLSITQFILFEVRFDVGDLYISFVRI